MLSGFIEATIELTGGERKADCCGVAATIHVVGRGQDGFVGADGKANFGFRLGPDAYDATLTLTYGPYTAGFCQPERRRGQDQREVPVVRRCRRPLERPRRVRDLDDQVLHQERGQGREGARGPGVQDDRVDLEVAGAPAGAPRSFPASAHREQVDHAHERLVRLDDAAGACGLDLQRLEALERRGRCRMCRGEGVHPSYWIDAIVSTRSGIALRNSWCSAQST